MTWYEVLTAAYYPPVAYLLAYGAPLLIGAIGYQLQMSVTGRRGLFVGLLRQRWVPRLWTAVGILGLVFCGYAYLVASSVAYILDAPALLRNAVGVTAVVIALFVFVDGLVFAGRPKTRRWRPAIDKDELPTVFGQVHGARRARIALQIYWYSMWRNLARFASGLAVTVTVIRQVAISEDDGLGGIVGVTIGFVVVLALVRFDLPSSVQSRLTPAAAAILVLGEIDHAMRGPTPRPQLADGDPLDWYRFRFREAATHLDQEARRLDGLIRGVGQHPVGAVLRSAAQCLRTFITSEASLVGRLPDDVQFVVSNLVLVLAGPGRDEPYCKLAHAVGAFDTDGHPVIVPRRLHPAIGTALTKAGQGSEALRNIAVLILLIGLSVLLNVIQNSP